MRDAVGWCAMNHDLDGIMTWTPEPAGSSSLDMKSGLDLTRQGDRLHLVKEIVAMANASGGVIRVVGGETATFDSAELRDLVGRYIAPDRLDLDVSHLGGEIGDGESGRDTVLSITVPAFRDPPLVFERDGSCDGPDGQMVVVFERHAVYRRRGTKAELATRRDFRGWTAAAAAAESERWRSRLALLAHLPPGAAVEVRPSDGGTVEEPGSFLRRAVGEYRDDATKLLSGRDLLAAFVARAAVSADAATSELIVQSALRRRPTLFLWLRLAQPEPGRVCTLLHDAIEARDRDKSDAGRSIVDVAALYLDDLSYQVVIDGLHNSHYAHFRQAGQGGTDRNAVLDRLDALRRAGPGAAPSAAISDGQLFGEADRLAGTLLDRQNQGQARRLTSVGIELLWRHLAIPATPMTEGRAELDRT
jgi:hypothetical protein